MYKSFFRTYTDRHDVNVIKLKSHSVSPPLLLTKNTSFPVTSRFTSLGIGLNFFLTLNFTYILTYIHDIYYIYIFICCPKNPEYGKYESSSQLYVVVGNLISREILKPKGCLLSRRSLALREYVIRDVPWASNIKIVRVRMQVQVQSNI